MEGLVLVLGIAIAVAVGIAVYVAPTVVVLVRRRPNPMPIIVINVLLGWTLLGWVAALAMAFHQPQQPVSVVQSGLWERPRLTPVPDDHVA